MKSQTVIGTPWEAVLSPCPWCYAKCHYIETDHAVTPVQHRVGVLCEPAMAADALHGDAMGNDWGRSNWFDEIDQAVVEWNQTRQAGCISNQLGVW